MGSCCGKQLPAGEETGDADGTTLKPVDARLVDKLILDMLALIASFVNNNQESPVSLVQLHVIADTEEGWIQVVTSIVNVIPLDDPFGPSAITILLDDCPLPSKDSVNRVSQLLRLSTERASATELDVKAERNICIVLGCLAEKLAGPNSVAILTEQMLNYLITFLNPSAQATCREACVVKFAMIALEKFAHTTENKIRIQKKLHKEPEHPLLVLENYEDSEDYQWRQVGFCAKWALDNVFVVQDRTLSFEKINMSHINAILNIEDVSEYLKISANGLEARCDSYSFESVRCTFQVNEGVWYYEVVIVTPGVMQIGWATKNSHFLNHEGYGIGDDLFSLSYDGCRRLIWHDARPTPFIEVSPWRPGDVLGCLIDLDEMEVIFSLNGTRLAPRKEIFASTRYGFFAAASFMAFQQCKFNFGSEAFRFPPTDRDYASFNQHGRLTSHEKMVIPKRFILEKLMSAADREDSCTLCCDEVASCTLEPCGHKGFCSVCTSQLKDCPMCRGPIRGISQKNT